MGRCCRYPEAGENCRRPLTPKISQTRAWGLTHRTLDLRDFLRQDRVIVAADGRRLTSFRRRASAGGLGE
jgi:hypothetical protein